MLRPKVHLYSRQIWEEHEQLTVTLNAAITLSGTIKKCTGQALLSMTDVTGTILHAYCAINNKNIIKTVRIY